ncbi:SusC/RagA family TonB-linked outer membrane protein [Flexithrix dorotheae]|uniref:SusC/RagA family TonB-linked outer membrane protein n=1 Tax=Flexithrix dorotheae TaxID=70993 RepID=UPI00035F1A3D|nr:SusC/RagA family TonB-linked outer membrane protein [Flexithrix dorotheae]
MSKLFFYGIFVQCLVGSVLLANNGNAQKASIDEVYLSLELENLTLKEVFEVISTKTDFDFAFNDSRINKNTKISVKVENESLGNVLRDISKNKKLKFKRIDEVIHVVKREKSLFRSVDVEEDIIQQQSVTGTVTTAEDAEPLPGVSVIVEGSSQGTVTDIDGKYTIEVPEGGSLQFSYIGFLAQTIAVGNQSVIDVKLEADIKQLQEVVVTALGVERETKALQYSVTEVGGDKFTEARENNLGNALVGRVAGVNVSKPSSGPAGSSRIIIRGNKTLGGQNQPLYVVDGVPIDNSGFGQAGLWGGSDEGDGLTSINPDDIESITVLKGANAAALYGSRGGNGVINITTKQGTKRKGIGVEFNSNYVVDKLYDQSDLQNKYGAGNYVNGVATRPTTAQQAFQWGNQSWGTAMDGSQVIQFDGVERPYSSAGDNFDRFFETGQAWTNTIAFSGGGDNQTFRFSISDLRSESIVPNSGFDKTNLTLNINSKFAKKLTLNAKVLYSHEEAKNRPRLSDSPSNSVQSVWRTPPSVNVETYKGDPNKPGAIPAGTSDELLTIYGQGGDPKFPGQELLPAANNWGQNPYWVTQVEQNTDIRDRFIASGSLRYDITDWLYMSGRIGMDWFTRRDTQLTPEGTGYNLGGARTEGEDRVREINMDWMLGFDKSFGKINVNAFAGGNKMHRVSERISANGNGFSVQFFDAINNAATRNFGYGFSESGINSVYGSAEISYDGYLFLTATARNDWFSVLNPEYNSILYPSVGASYIFSDHLESLPSWLSFGKVRASWAQVGIANINPYDANLTYSLNGNTHLGYNMATFSSAGGNNGSIPNPQLQPATSTEMEFGVDLRFFENRFGVDFTYYDQKTTDDILNATISRASGFGSTFVNIGEITNKGIEVLLTGTPIQGDFTWDVALNFAKNNNEVVSLIEGSDELSAEEPRTRNVRIKHIVGQPFGTITGRVQQTTEDGTPIFNEDGTPLASTDYVPIGNGVPDFTGGLNNTLSYKGFTLDFLIDFKSGGDIFSGTNNRLTQWGLHQQSLIGRAGEAPLHINGVVNTGTPEAPVYTPVDRDLTVEEANIYWNRVGGESTAISSMFIYDASFVKLRQMTLGYSFPRSMLANTPIQNLTLSLVGRNLWVISKNIDNVDPESGYSNNAGAQGLEYFALPATRSYGFNLRVGF